MSVKTIISMTAIVAGSGLFLAGTAMAQTTAAPASQDGVSQHHKALYQLMKDMNQEMGTMTEQMGRSDLTPEQRTQMAKRMEAMSSMMHRMSGFEAMPAMMAADQKGQMEQMRKHMDEMMRDSKMMPGSK
ncbi:hypothetical protein [Thermomonas sp.]|uniref:hypothetical protein n=1 Tax=Thermomonas sp. TaxID=1971895 RepID=UPI00248902CB|nr:hypothetical protein [Thermomonas sp.]MDI1252528.1 hypothetical protein [Thermomonas sp.]